jgi:hypothetical protein
MMSVAWLVLVFLKFRDREVQLCPCLRPGCVMVSTHTKGLLVIVQYDGSDEAKSHRRGMPGAQRHASSSSEMATEMDLENTYARTLHELESQVWGSRLQPDALYLSPSSMVPKRHFSG